MDNKKYLSIVINQLEQIYAYNQKTLINVTNLIKNQIQSQHKIFIIGSGHSHMICEETYVRAGGNDIFIPILEPELMLHQNPFKSTYIERTCEYAQIIIDLYKITSGDVIIIVSNSGINNLPIELALKCKDINAHVVSISNESIKSSIDSRHKSKKYLFEIADYNFHNFGVIGDACIEIKEKTKVGPTSTITNTFIIQSLLISLSQKISNLSIYNSANTNLDTLKENEIKFQKK